jgi:aspartyl-tRNA(Asn)/glutamyl-tRNA(Gln) amidotransferase subunit B
MRFDVNISVAPEGSTELGTRAEVKNLNSFRSVERAAEYEFQRQVELLNKGERIVQETRGWDDAKGRTSSQRSKEDAQDYRYMPDADIPPVILSDEEIAAIQADLPPLPPYYRDAWASLGLDKSVVDSLLHNQQYALLISDIQKKADDNKAKRVAHWFSSAVNVDDETAIIDHDLAAEPFIELASMVDANELSSTAAKEIFNDLLSSKNSPTGGPRAIAEQKNLLQVSDEGAIAATVDEVLADPANAKAIADIQAGNERVIGFLVGQIMKKSQGKANPAMAQKLIRERL